MGYKDYPWLTPTTTATQYPPGEDITAVHPLLHFLSSSLHLSFLLLVLRFIIARRSLLFRPHLSPTPFKLFFFLLSWILKHTNTVHTHTHTHFLIISSFWHSLTSSPLFFIHICAESCEMSPNRDKSSVPGKSGSDITDTVSHTRTKTHNESSVKW